MSRVVWFTPPGQDPNLPADDAALLNAAGLMIAILQTAGVGSHQGLRGKLPDHVRLTADQVSLLARFERELVYVGDRTRMVVCPACHRWTINTGKVPGSCRATLGCEGKPVASTAWTQSRVPPESAKSLKY